MDVLYWNGCGPSCETTVLPAFSHMDYFTGPTWHSPYCSDELHSWSLFFLGKILRYPEMHHIQLWPQRKEKKKKPPFALGVFTDPENVFYKIFLCYPKMHHTQLWPYFLFKKTERKKKPSCCSCCLCRSSKCILSNIFACIHPPMGPRRVLAQHDVQIEWLCFCSLFLLFTSSHQRCGSECWMSHNAVPT